MEEHYGQEIAERLHQINTFRRRQHHHSNGSGKGQGFHGRLRLLRLLSHQDGLSQRELADLLDIRPQSLGELIQKMETDRLLERKNSSADRRKLLIYLTKEGKRVFEEHHQERHKESQALFSSLNTDEQKELLRLLDIILQTARKGDENS